MIAKLRTFLPLVCLAAVATAGVARADDFYGTAYADMSGNAFIPSSIMTNEGHFTVDSLNFTSPPSAYTIGGFLSGGSNLVINPTLGAMSLSNQELVFSGKVALTAGTTYSFSHDDGMILVVDGVTVINKPNQVYATLDSFTATTTTVANVSLYYAENQAAPADLTNPSGNFTPVPEPSSILMLGSGLVGLAGVVRRKIKR